MSDAEQRLSLLRGELWKTAEKIATGQAKVEAIDDLTRRINRVEAEISGYRSVIESKDQEIQHLTPQLRQAEEASLWEKRRAELAQLVAEGKAIAETINAKLRSIITEDLVRFDAVRDKLRASHLVPLGSQNEALALIRMTIEENGQLVLDRSLTNLPHWRDGRPSQVRGDIQLLVRNLIPPR